MDKKPDFVFNEYDRSPSRELIEKNRRRRKLRKMVSKNIVNEINIVKTCFKAYLNIGNSYKYIKWLDNY